MKRKVHSDKERLDWTIRLVWTPEAIRPLRSEDAWRQTGRSGVYGGPSGGVGLPLVFSLILFLLLVIPVMLVVLPLRYARVLPWTIQATTYPWGKRGGPAEVQRWLVKGRRAELKQVIEEIGAALERGETRPDVAGATRVRA